MSGPKVVRVVTIEEKIAICETQLALLNASVQSLSRYLDVHGIKDEKLKSNLEKKIEHYKAIATPDSFRKIPGQIQRELDYISSEFDRIKTKELEQARGRHRRIRKLSESLKTLQLLASGSGLVLDPSIDLSHSELCEKSDEGIRDVEQKVSSQISELSINRKAELAGEKLTGEQKEIRERLASKEEALHVSDWKLVNTKQNRGVTRSDRIDTVMAELDEMEFPQSRKSVFHKQLDAIYEENSDKKRTLLLDSLVIDLAMEARAYRRTKKAKHELSIVQAQVDVLEGNKAKKLSKQIEKAMKSEIITDLEGFLSGATRKLEEIITARSIEQGKEALLEALHSFGYRVSEGMNTAVVEDGKLVVKKPSEEVYGVEVQAIAATGKFQIRLVSGLSDNERSAKDDIEEEKKWCSDLDEISKTLAESGIDFGIEKALEPGAQVVKHSSAMAEMLELEKRVVSARRNRLEN